MSKFDTIMFLIILLICCAVGAYMGWIFAEIAKGLASNG